MANVSNNAAKYAFFYMLSLVALVFTALSAGMIIFQFINKNIEDVLQSGGGQFSPEALKFAISALVIATPIFYLTSRQIQKSLFSGALDRESGIRKWLTYFILFIASVVMLGWLISTINSFLDGELTMKFFLKAFTAIGIAAAVFTFYYYDIRRSEIVNKKDRVVAVYFYVSLVFILAVFTASLFIVESPRETRSRKLDNAVLDSFNQVDQAVNEYYRENKKMPENLEILRQEYVYLSEKDLKDPETGKAFELRVTGDRSYELCAVFRTANNEDNNSYNDWYKERWPHIAGEQCLKQRVEPILTDEQKIVPLPIR